MKRFLFAVIALALISCVEQNFNNVQENSDEAVVTEMKCAAGQFSPDGKFIAFSGEKFKGLFVKNIETSEIVKITESDGAGWRFSWSPDSRGIAFRETISLDNSTKYRIQKRFVDQKNNELVGEFENTVWPPLWKDTIYSVDTVRSSNISLAVKPLSILKTPLNPMKFNVFTSNNQVSLIDIKTGALRNLAEGTHSPSISADGRFVLFVHLDLIKILDTVKNTTVDVGKGSSPRWAGSLNNVIYNVTLDNGRDITYAEVRIYNMKTRTSKVITVSADRIPLSPSISFDGKKLLYTDNISGHLFIKTLGTEM